MNLQWPKTPENNLVPWYLVLARTPGALVYLAGHLLATLGVFLMHGTNAASEYWSQL